MKQFIPLLLAGVMLASPSFDAQAWGGQGHRLVARIADTQLTPQARAAVDELLKGEADPTLSGIASWADELRGSDPDLGKRTASWHYVNIAEHDCQYLKERDCKDGDCVTEALKEQSAILADTSRPLAERTQALKFVVHFTGDIHQPMHAGYAHDKGGNNFQLHFNGRGTNLHSLWDSGMVYDRRLTDDEYLKELLALPAPDAAELVRGDRDPELWSESVCRIAIAPGVYPARPGTVPTGYVSRHRPVVEQHLRLAGDRLAVLLNALLGQP